MTKSKSILFLSDIHCGSYYAPCTPEPEIQLAKTTWNPTKLQKELYGYWNWVKDQLSEDPFLVVINGEPIDGDNPRDAGGSLWSNNVDDQILDFCKLMKIYNPRHITMTRGSGYHVLKGNTSYEDTVARLLKVKPYETNRSAEKHKIWTEQRHEKLVIDDILDFRINGKVFNVAHAIGYNKAYHNKAQAMTALLAEMEFARGKYWKSEDFPSVFVRSHVHYYVQVAFARVRGFSTPAFKLSMDRYFTRQGVPQPPSIGAVEVIVEGNGHISVEPHVISNDMYPKHDIMEF